MSVVKQIYSLRRKILIIGLTGRTGSGCTTVAKMLNTDDFSTFKLDFQGPNASDRTNDSRKISIVSNYMRKHWHPFFVIQAGDIIFYYALQLDFDMFIKALLTTTDDNKTDDNSTDEVRNSDLRNQSDIDSLISKIKEGYELVHSSVVTFESCLKGEMEPLKEFSEYAEKVFQKVSNYRKSINSILSSEFGKDFLRKTLARWGDNIRLYDSISKQIDPLKEAPFYLAKKIDSIISLLCQISNNGENHFNVVIDALRNPCEVFYFRENYASFYLMSINTDEANRRGMLAKYGYTYDEINKIDKSEAKKEDYQSSFVGIDVDRCVELADIHIFHDERPHDENRDLMNQLITYIALMKHPGLVTPTPEERTMQIAYTAKLNSGCITRQVGAAIVNKDYSLESIGWNNVPIGQTPCNLRDLLHLVEREDRSAFGDYEWEKESPFGSNVSNLYKEYQKEILVSDPNDNTKLIKRTVCEECAQGLPIAFCFRDVYNPDTQNARFSRSIQASENAILQAAKYGHGSLEGGIMFSTARCSEQCCREAYQLGIKKIIYINSGEDYKVATANIMGHGRNKPSMDIFHGAIGRAYVNLFEPYMPLKEELLSLTGIRVRNYSGRKTKVGSDGKESNEKNS